MRKNIVCLILGTALLGATLAGCGNEVATSATSESSTTSTTSATSATSATSQSEGESGTQTTGTEGEAVPGESIQTMAAKLFLLPLWNIRMQLRILLFILHLISVRRPWWRLMMLWVRD